LAAILQTEDQQKFDINNFYSLNAYSRDFSELNIDQIGSRFWRKSDNDHICSLDIVYSTLLGPIVTLKK
jgi:hypothetical protein